MKNFDTDMYSYDPRDHRLDLPSVFAGFVMLSAILAGVFLI